MLPGKFARIRLVTYLILSALIAWHLYGRKRVIETSLSALPFPEIVATDLRKPDIPRLDRPQDFPALYRDAVATVSKAIEETGLHPSEYWVELRLEDSGRRLDFSLWHESIVGKNYSNEFKGDISGKSRTVEYDALSGKVVKISSWR